MLASRPERWITRRDAIKGLTAGAVGAVTGAVVHGYVYERRALRVVRATLPVSGLPDGLVGVRVGFLTDLHRSRTVPHDLIAGAVDLLGREEPDVVLLGGDYVTDGDRQYAEPAAEVLAPLSAPHGVFAVLGNHDDDRHVPAALARQGITVLADARTRLTIRGEPFEIAGIRFWTRRVADIARVLRGVVATTLLLAQDPRRLRDAAALDVPVLLSGHTHGGQIVIAGIAATGLRRFPVLAGIARQDNTTLFVSRGVGTVFVPVRFNCPPEVALLTLEKRGAM